MNRNFRAVIPANEIRVQRSSVLHFREMSLGRRIPRHDRDIYHSFHCSEYPNLPPESKQNGEDRRRVPFTKRGCRERVRPWRHRICRRKLFDAEIGDHQANRLSGENVDRMRVGLRLKGRIATVPDMLHERSFSPRVPSSLMRNTVTLLLPKLAINK